MHTHQTSKVQVRTNRHISIRRLYCHVLYCTNTRTQNCVQSISQQPVEVLYTSPHAPLIGPSTGPTEESTTCSQVASKPAPMSASMSASASPRNLRCPRHETPTMGTQSDRRTKRPPTIVGSHCDALTCPLPPQTHTRATQQQPRHPADPPEVLELVCEQMILWLAPTVLMASRPLVSRSTIAKCKPARSK